MREILFRGKRLDNGDWVEGYLEYFTTAANRLVCYISAWGKKMHEVYPDTVGQYTGLKDRNGKRIFDGDIVRHWNCSKRGCDTGKVYWDDCFCGWRRTTDGTFHGTFVRDYRMSSECDYEVIGNIHDNTELLEDT